MMSTGGKILVPVTRVWSSLKLYLAVCELELLFKYLFTYYLIFYKTLEQTWILVPSLFLTPMYLIGEVCCKVYQSHFFHI